MRMKLSARKAYQLLQGRTAQHLRTHSKPVDLSRVFSNGQRVVHWGEYHDNLAAKHELIDHLPRLRGLGVTHLGMEMFFLDAQPALDRYFADPTDEHLRPIRQSLHFFGHRYGVAPDYERLIVTAARLGIRIMGLDNNPGARGLANYDWVNVTASVLRGESAARMIVYGGAAHLGYHPWIDDCVASYLPANQLLTEMGFSGQVILVMGGMDAQYADSVVTTALRERIAEQELANSHFMVDLAHPTADITRAIVASDANTPWPDTIIHRPQRDFGAPGHIGHTDDAHWHTRWSTFNTRSWEQYVFGDDPLAYEEHRRAEEHRNTMALFARLDAEQTDSRGVE